MEGEYFNNSITISFPFIRNDSRMNKHRPHTTKNQPFSSFSYIEKIYRADIFRFMYLNE